MVDQKAPFDSLIHRINVGDLLTRSAARTPRRLAVVDGDRQFTYRALNEWVNRTAHGFASLGYGRGDALALMSSNAAEFLVTYFACAKLGIICVPICSGGKANSPMCWTMRMFGASSFKGLCWNNSRPRSRLCPR